MPCNCCRIGNSLISFVLGARASPPNYHSFSTSTCAPSSTHVPHTRPIDPGQRFFVRGLKFVSVPIKLIAQSTRSSSSSTIATGCQLLGDFCFKLKFFILIMWFLFCTLQKLLSIMLWKYFYYNRLIWYKDILSFPLTPHFASNAFSLLPTFFPFFPFSRKSHKNLVKKWFMYSSQRVCTWIGSSSSYYRKEAFCFLVSVFVLLLCAFGWCFSILFCFLLVCGAVQLQFFKKPLSPNSCQRRRRRRSKLTASNNIQNIQLMPRSTPALEWRTGWEWKEIKYIFICVKNMMIHDSHDSCSNIFKWIWWISVNCFLKL